VSACVWSEQPLTAAGDEAGIEVKDIFELVAESADIEVGGYTSGPPIVGAEEDRS
jgi:heterodisulfide reductase subunit D